MYAPARLFSIRSAACLIAGASACALLAGCAGNPFQDAKVDPRSPVAGEVARVAHANRAWPTFAAIPPVPKDVRAAGQYGRQAKAVEQARAELEQNTAPGTWSLEGTESFAADARREAGNEAAPSSGGEAAAFANAQRKRATPPPPPPR